MTTKIRIFAIFASLMMLTVIAMPMVAAEANKDINNSPGTVTDIEGSIKQLIAMHGNRTTNFNNYEEPDIDTPTTEEVKEYALNQIEEATEKIQDVRSDIEKLNITETLILDLINKSEIQLDKAEAAFDQGNYSLSFIYASKAENLAEKADALIDKIEWLDEKDWEITVKIEYRKAHVEVDLDEVEMEFTLDTANKEDIIQEIMVRTGLDRFVVEKITVFEIDDEVIEKVEELAYELEYALIELGETGSEIFVEINETTIVIEDAYHELMGIRSDLKMLDIDPVVRGTLISKLDNVLNNTNRTIFLIQNGVVVQADGLFNEVVLDLNAFITEVEAHSGDKIGEDDAEMLVERVEEVIEDTEGEIGELIKELEGILIEIDENMVEVRRIVSELKVLGAEIEIEVTANSAVATAINIILYGIGTVAKIKILPVIAGILLGVAIYQAILPQIKEIKNVTKQIEFEIKVAAFVASPLLTAYIGIKAPETLGDMIGDGIRGNTSYGVISKFIVATKEPFGDIFLANLGLALVVILVRQEITRAPGMDEWRWFDGDFGWTHEIPKDLWIESARLCIRAFDVDWGPESFWEHNIIYADRHNIGTLTGTPPRRWNNEWSITTFNIDTALLADGRLDVSVDIDSNHNLSRWVTLIDWSALEFSRIGIKQIDPDVILRPK